MRADSLWPPVSVGHSSLVYTYTEQLDIERGGGGGGGMTVESDTETINLSEVFESSECKALSFIRFSFTSLYQHKPFLFSSV